MKSKLHNLVFFLIFLSSSSIAQSGQWAWISGDSISNSTIVNYGVQGIASSSNIPEPTYEGANWTDSQGRFWFFGGVRTTALFNNLWMFDPSIKQWAWMKGPQVGGGSGVYGIMGISSPLNNPGARGWGCSTWTDLSGNLWLFGGLGSSSSTGGGGFLADLWKYNITTNEWTWMNGPQTATTPGVYGTKGVSSPLNYPAGRYECSANWVDNFGNLWLYGGAILNNSSVLLTFGDLWKYDISINEWTWVSGSMSPSIPPVYGTKGIADSLNFPGSRMPYAKWKDSQGNFYLFGGSLTSYYGDELNDLWKYEISTNQWTWVSGAKLSANTGSTGSLGHYGSKCIASINNYPTSRNETRACWTDHCNNFWLLGGTKCERTDSYNDLWQYNPSTLEWTWVSGDSTLSNVGHYGSKNLFSLSNIPSSRLGALSWMDNSNNLWLFAGAHDAPLSGLNKLNDMWEYIPDSMCAGSKIVSGSLIVNENKVICAGDTTLLQASGASNYSWSPTYGLNVTTGSLVIASPSITTIYTVQTTDILCHSKAIVTVTIKPPPPLIVSRDTVICKGSSINIGVVSGAYNNYNWLPNYGLNSVVSSTAIASPSISTVYTISAQSNCGIATNTISIKVDTSLIIQGLKNYSVCPGNTATISVSGGVTYTWSPSFGLNTINGSTVIVSSTSSQTYMVQSKNSCGTSTLLFNFHVFTPEPISINGATGICNGGSAILSATGATNYTWSPSINLSGINTPSVIANPSNPVLYTISANDSHTCLTTTTFFLNVYYPPTLILLKNIDLCKGESVILVASGANTYTWSPSIWLNSINGNTVIVNPPSDFLYYLTAESFPGCSSKDSISVVVKDCEQELIAPNVFTPNGDNVNDLFFLKVKGAKNFNIHIYNRWGQLLYESTDPKAPWNGKMKSINQNAPDGTYYYIADVEFENNSKTQTFQGFFQLIR